MRNKYFITSLIILICILAITVITHASELDTEEVTELKVTTMNANLWDMPNENIVGRLEKGQTVYVIEEVQIGVFGGLQLTYLKINTAEGQLYIWDGFTEYEKSEQITRKVDEKSYSGNNDVIDSMEYIGNFCVTTYCPCKICNGGHTCTALGTELIPGETIAVDPNVIPLGSVVYLEGIGMRVAEDVGGMVKGKHIDLCISSHEEAQHLTYYDVPVYICK